MENTMTNKTVFDIKSQVCSIILSSNDFLENKGYEIDFKHKDEFSERLSNVFHWLFFKCGIERFKFELGVFLNNYDELIISRWFQVKNGELKNLGGDVGIKKFDFDQRCRGIDVGRSMFILDVSFSEEFSNYWFKLESYSEKSNILYGIEKFIRSQLLVSYIGVNPGGVHFEIPIKFEVVKYLI